MASISVSCFHVLPFLFFFIFLFSIGHDTHFRFLFSCTSVFVSSFLSSFFIRTHRMLFHPLATSKLSLFYVFFMCFLSISIYPGTDHHGLPRSSSPISPVGCCSFLVPSRSQSQLVVCFRVPWPALLLFPSWARPSLWLFQWSVKAQFFSCWPVPVRLFPLSCTHAPLPTATRCSNDSLSCENPTCMVTTSHHLLFLCEASIELGLKGAHAATILISWMTLQSEISS
jgi:hypothetical protein